MAFSDALGPNTGVSRAQRKSGKLDATRQAGRFGDSELVHATPFTQALLKNMGGSGTRNPKTGLLEFFNEQDYLAANKDVADAIADGSWTGSAEDHFNLHGQSEGRSLAPSVPDTFNSDAYLAANQDVADNWDGNAYNHYLLHGEAEGRSTGAPEPAPSPTSSIDPNASNYATMYHQLRGVDTDFAGLGMEVPDYSQTAVSTAAFQNPHHFITEDGDYSQLVEAMQTGAFRFNPEFYAAQNPDLAQNGIDTLEELIDHYATFGYKEGRLPGVGAPTYDSPISDGAGGIVPGLEHLTIDENGNVIDTSGGAGTGDGTGTGTGDGTGTGTDINGFTLADIEALIRSIMGEGGGQQSAAPGNDFLEMLLSAILANNQQPTYDPLSFLNAMGYLEDDGINGHLIGSTNRVASRNRFSGPPVDASGVTPAPALDPERATRRGGFGAAISF